MKKITLVLMLTFLFTSISFAQKGSSLEKANYYLKSKGEVILKFKANSKAQFLELNEILSVSHQHVDENTLEVEAHANSEHALRIFYIDGNLCRLQPPVCFRQHVDD